jgi:butyrate kinase
MVYILVINPGSTSSKIALFRDETEIYQENIIHSPEALARFVRVADQYVLRRDAVLQALASAKVGVSSLGAVVGRGGLLDPVPSGTYRISEAMLDRLRRATAREHISNLGAVIAQEIATLAGVPAFIVDPVTVDEFEPLARVAGLPEIQRRSESHALNIKAVARQAAAALGGSYHEMNMVVVHLGAGISVTAHRHGKMVDVNQGLDGTGPFSPERAGGLPVGDVMRLAYAGRSSYDELWRRVSKLGGLYAHLGTNDAIEVERRIAAGDDHARLIYEAMAYQIAKEIGLMATVLSGDVQGIALTGGLAHSEMLMAWIRKRVEWIAPVLIYPGQREMLAMAQGALRVLRGQEEAKEYQDYVLPIHAG